MRAVLRPIRIAAAGLTLVLLLVSPAFARAAKTVEVDDDFFNPLSLVIKERTIVKFEWVGVGDHDVYKQSGPGRKFTSGIHFGAGVHFSRKFRKRGSYVLACTLHPDMVMNLKVKRRR